jgi:hypothetical protein
MTKMVFILMPTISMILYNGCNENPVFNNPSDPASNRYSPPASKIIMVEDFDDGNYANLWSHGPLIYEEAGGKIDTSLILLTQQSWLPVKGYALRLKYDVTRRSSVAAWGQFLNDFDTGTFFNPRILGLKTFSFWVRGEKGGETFAVKFSDSSEYSYGQMIWNAISPVTTEWQKASFSLNDFEHEGFNHSQLWYFHFNFFDSLTPNSGVIYIDNIAFEY